MGSVMSVTPAEARDRRRAEDSVGEEMTEARVRVTEELMPGVSGVWEWLCWEGLRLVVRLKATCFGISVGWAADTKSENEPE